MKWQYNTFDVLWPAIVWYTKSIYIYNGTEHVVYGNNHRVAYYLSYINKHWLHHSHFCFICATDFTSSSQTVLQRILH